MKMGDMSILILASVVSVFIKDSHVYHFSFRARQDHLGDNHQLFMINGSVPPTAFDRSLS